MPTTLENKLSNLIYAIKELKKEMILQEITKTRIAKHNLIKWKALGEEVSSKWDEVSAVEEISQQRKKLW